MIAQLISITRFIKIRIFQYFNAKINGEEEEHQIELQRKKKIKKEFCPRRPSKDMHKCCCKKKEEKKIRSLERQTIKKRRKKKTLHKWTPDSDAYLSVGYGSNIIGLL